MSKFKIGDSVIHRIGFYDPESIQMGYKNLGELGIVARVEITGDDEADKCFEVMINKFNKSWYRVVREDVMSEEEFRDFVLKQTSF